MITVDMSQMRTGAIEKASIPAPPSGEIQILVTQLDDVVASLEAHCRDLLSQLTPVVCIAEVNEVKVPSAGVAPAARTQLGGALAQLVSRVEELRGKIAKASAGLEL